MSNPAEILSRPVDRLETAYGSQAENARAPGILACKSGSTLMERRREGTTMCKELVSQASWTKACTAALRSPTRSWRSGVASIIMFSEAQLEAL